MTTDKQNVGLFIGRQKIMQFKIKYIKKNFDLKLLKLKRTNKNLAIWLDSCFVGLFLFISAWHRQFPSQPGLICFDSIIIKFIANLVGRKEKVLGKEIKIGSHFKILM